MRGAVMVAFLVVWVGCGDAAPPEEDASVRDAGAGEDAGGPPDDAATGEDAAADDAAVGDDGGGGEDAGGPTGSAGCGMPSELATGEWIERSVDVDGTTRVWFVWLPEGYDPARRYPVVYQWHGCSDRRENNNVPVQRESGGDAIHVRGRAVERCWDTSPAGPDVAFFDALVREVESTWCADPERRFATGYSSGAFMTHQLSCVRGDALAGVASIAGGQAGRSCEGRTAALLIHDRGDGTVGIGASEGARDRHLMRNGCGDGSAPVEPSPCERYEGCDAGFDVVWCETEGMGHARQDGLAAPAFWNFLNRL